MDRALPLRQLLYFGYHRLGGRSVGRVYRQLLAEDRARLSSGGEIDRLRLILLHAARKVPHYEVALGGRGREIEADPVAVLRSLPLLTRDIVDGSFDALLSTDAGRRRAVEQMSGGSTGEPVRLLQDSRFREVELAVTMLQASWSGWRFGEPEVWIWGSERDILNGNGRLRSRLANRLIGRRYFNAFQLTPDSMRECLRHLQQDPPRLIVAYAHTLDDLAAFALDEGIVIGPQQAIISTASTLHPLMRERIERAFGCRVFDQYGSREVGDIACECDHHRGLHVIPWMNFVEVVGDDGEPVEPGREGRVIVTSLCNYAMPLIRYEVGDRARLVAAGEPPCPCGRKGPRLAEVVGRIGDTFKAADGTHVASGYFIHMLFFRDFVKRFQVVQTEPSRVVYRLITSGSPSGGDLEEIARDTRAVMGEACAVDFEFPDELPASPSGKYRYTISEC
jgi:phenylacetate-CoA ligase